MLDNTSRRLKRDWSTNRSVALKYIRSVNKILKINNKAFSQVLILQYNLIIFITYYVNYHSFFFKLFQ